MDMNTIALIKGLAGNGGGGSSLPTNPAQDGTYALQNTVSSGTSTLSWASGSSGGGVLVVHQDENGTLDKTWQEIHDGMPAVIIADDGDDRYAYCVQSVTKAPDGTSFIVTVGSMADNTAYTDNYVASSASGYPTLAS